MTISPAQFVAWLPDDMQLQWLAVLDAETRARLRWDWRFWARREQIAPMSD